MEPCPGEPTCKVLVAEDNPLNAQLALAILGFADCHVTAVENGAKALEAIQSTTYQLVLMDVHMPEMSGIEVTKRVRQAERDGGLPALLIVGVTASAMVHEIQQCIDAGMNSIMIKPVSVSELLSLVAQACSQKSQKPCQSGHSQAQP